MKSLCIFWCLSSHLQHRGHEDRAAHQGEDHEASEALLSDAQELGLLSGGRTLRLQLQAVDMGDGEHGGCHKPRQAHHRAHAQHHPHHKQVQVVATAFLQGAGQGQWGLDTAVITLGELCYCLTHFRKIRGQGR